MKKRLFRFWITIRPVVKPVWKYTSRVLMVPVIIIGIIILAFLGCIIISILYVAFGMETIPESPFDYKHVLYKRMKQASVILFAVCWMGCDNPDWMGNPRINELYNRYEINHDSADIYFEKWAGALEDDKTDSALWYCAKFGSFYEANNRIRDTIHQLLFPRTKIVVDTLDKTKSNFK